VAKGRTDELGGDLDDLDHLVAGQAGRADHAQGAHDLAVAELDCLRKGKARTPFVFSTKTGIAVSAKSHWRVGARAFPGAPFDGHTRHEQIEQASELMQDLGVKPTTAALDLGYLGVDAAHAKLTITQRGKAKRPDEQGLRLIKRHNPMEPAIRHRHLKADTGWTDVASWARSEIGCMSCCAQWATTAPGCCGSSFARA
jgi:hypothetical protein